MSPNVAYLTTESEAWAYLARRIDSGQWFKLGLCAELRALVDAPRSLNNGEARISSELYTNMKLRLQDHMYASSDGREPGYVAPRGEPEYRVWLCLMLAEEAASEGPMIATVPAGLLTYSGVFVPKEAGHVPSIEDIALSLSRMPRFGGHARQDWSVLQHSLFVEGLARRHAAAKGWSARLTQGVRLVALLHDAHEAITGDIPTHFKTPDMRGVQRNLDDRIFGRYVQELLPQYTDGVHELDGRALLAEALLVGPPALRTDHEVQTYFGAKPDEEALSLLREMLKDPVIKDPFLSRMLFVALVDKNGGL